MHIPLENLGHRNALTENEESLIVSFLLRQTERGTPLTHVPLQQAIEPLIAAVPPSGKELILKGWGKPSKMFNHIF